MLALDDAIRPPDEQVQCDEDRKPRQSGQGDDDEKGLLRRRDDRVEVVPHLGDGDDHPLLAHGDVGLDRSGGMGGKKDRPKAPRSFPAQRDATRARLREPFRPSRAGRLPRCQNRLQFGAVRGEQLQFLQVEVPHVGKGPLERERRDRPRSPDIAGVAVLLEFRDEVLDEVGRVVTLHLREDGSSQLSRSEAGPERADENDREAGAREVPTKVEGA